MIRQSATQFVPLASTNSGAKLVPVSDTLAHCAGLGFAALSTIFHRIKTWTGAIMASF